MSSTAGSSSPAAPGLPRVLPHLIDDDVGAAIDWLTAAFGFNERTFARHVGGEWACP